MFLFMRNAGIDSIIFPDGLQCHAGWPGCCHRLSGAWSSARWKHRFEPRMDAGRSQNVSTARSLERLCCARYVAVDVRVYLHRIVTPDLNRQGSTVGMTTRMGGSGPATVTIVP
jgi:hypothetical protein